jgi:hypothetical protein
LVTRDNNTLNLVRSLNRCPDLNRKLHLAHSRLRSLHQQDKDSQRLYQLLARQNQLWQQQLASLEASPRSPDSSLPVKRLQTELQHLTQLVTTHCHLVAWLYQGNDDSGGPVNNLPLPKPQSNTSHPSSSVPPGSGIGL